MWDGGFACEIFGQNPNAVRDAKGHRRGLPNYAYVKLADLLGTERIEVIAASELVMEKKPERREVWLPFVPAASCCECPGERRSGCDRRNANGPRSGAV
jgi:hypothetical protein